MQVKENFNQLRVCSMSYSIKVSGSFAKEAKRLAKKYPSFKKDYEIFLESLQENPLQGDGLTPGIRKIRMAIKYNVIAEQNKGLVCNTFNERVTRGVTHLRPYMSRFIQLV